MPKSEQQTMSGPDEEVLSRIHLINGQKVVLDYDLASMYGVSTKALNQAVKRNIEKFPSEFVFRLSKESWRIMRSQIVTTYSQLIDLESINEKDSRSRWQTKRNSSTVPLAFTEHGVAMAANVLKSEKATQVSLVIVKTFIQLRRQLLDYTGSCGK